ncbi:MAG TPA: cytochrome c oxidase assembly protein [Candidatus Acidoferrales bacterium]|nr:cytochrome c oxidase assembly protein [Candidatus Acidoferrales bacterium]
MVRHDVITWPFDPSVDLGLLAAEAGYIWLSRRHRGTLGQAAFYVSGLLLIWLALETPLDPLGDHYLQSAHMVQHMVLIAVAPPLLLLGLSRRMASAVLRLPGLAGLTQPVPGMIAYSLSIVFWHVPAVYDVAIANTPVHILEHLSFLAAGLLMWWPVIEATGQAGPNPLSSPMKLVYLFMASLPMMTVALVLQFSQVVFYSVYRTEPEILGGITPVIDQNIAGSLMLFIDLALTAFDMIVIFVRWARAEQIKDQLLAP